MSDDTLSGQCHCGQVSYSASGPSRFSFLCHCDSCRRLNGGARLAGAATSAAGLDVSGRTTAYRYPGGSGEIEAHFCPTCGTTLYALVLSMDDAAVLRANTLADDVPFEPVKSIFADQACAWDTPIS